MSISLSKALNIKNKLVSEIAELEKKIKNYNVQLTTDKKYDVKALLTSWQNKKLKLQELKGKIAIANVGIYHHLAKVEETKSTISFIKGLNVDGMVQERVVISSGVQNTITNTYLPELTREEQDVMLQSLQDMMAELFDEISKYNFNTKIDFE